VADLSGRRLYLCTADRPDLERFVAACIEGGVDVVQLRDKELPARSILARAAIVRKVCAEAGVPFILNDRPDLALEAGADGVHVGQDDVPASVARRILGPDAIIGLSTHSEADLAASHDQPVDYIAAGPVVPTATHPDRQAVGVSYIRHAVGHARRPVWVTGGMSPGSVASVVHAGARHVVVVRWLTEARDPREAARALRRALEEAIDRSVLAPLEPTQQQGDGPGVVA
jgi:thiamine-phosphate pyrophosphorylase